jgi:hypothetical protein
MKFIKKLSNMRALLMALVCAFVLLSAFSAKTYAATATDATATNVATTGNPVQLYYANSFLHAYTHPGVAADMDGYIAIQNLAYNKNVTVHYSLDNSNVWNDVSASYYKTNTDGYEVWHFKTPIASYGSIKFAIKYEVNGQTYWDNNNGNDYSITTEGTCFGKSSVCLRSAYSEYYPSAGGPEVFG